MKGFIRINRGTGSEKLLNVSDIVSVEHCRSYGGSVITIRVGAQFQFVDAAEPLKTVERLITEAQAGD